MKIQIVKMLVRAGFLAAIATAAGLGSAHGQSLSNSVRAHIPFDFTVADQKFPAGEYLISRAQPSSGDLMLRIDSVAGNRKAFRLTNAVVTLAPKKSHTLVFHQYGDRYFLSEVWPAGATAGRTLLESRGEREARGGTATDKVAMKVRTVSVSGTAQ